MMDLPNEKSSFYTRHNVSSSFWSSVLAQRWPFLVRKYLENEILHIAMLSQDLVPKRYTIIL